MKGNGDVFMTLKLYLDPGHGGADAGAAGNGLYEKNVTLQIAASIQKILNEEYVGHVTKMSRTSDTHLPSDERISRANKWGATFYLGVHVHEGEQPGYADFIYEKSGKQDQETAYQMIIHDEVIRATAFQDRGKQTAGFRELGECHMPALWTENGCLNSIEDCKKIKRESFIERMARGYVKGLVRAFGLEKRPSRENPDPPFLIMVKAGSLYYYNKPNWRARAGIAHKGQIFTVIGKLTKKRAKMYKLKSGHYMTANPKYVEILPE